MTKPQDLEPSQAIELAGSEGMPSLQRRLWALRVFGLVILVSGWCAIFFGLVDNSRELLIGTIIIAALGVVAFATAINSRLTAVHWEKKLRLRLLVHNMELENMAIRDDLTQLFNRRYFFERLQKELESAQGFDRPLAVIMMDVDSLKAVNDTHGHRVGDQVLASFGRFLLEQTRATDIPARIGGDEFAVILPDTSKRGACNMMKRFLRNLDDISIDNANGSSIRLSASFGVSGYPWGATDVDALMQQADAAMYAHKLIRDEGHPPPGANDTDAVEMAPALPAQPQQKVSAREDS